MRAWLTPSDFGIFYNARQAASELRNYRNRGPIPSTRMLIDALKAEGVQGATLIDIGGGIGAIQHELLAAGVAHVTSIDASHAYIQSAQEESQRRGLTGRVTYHHGDFVELADTIPPADIVTLDRVINVYQDWKRLVQLSAVRARRLYGLVYPAIGDRARSDRWNRYCRLRVPASTIGTPNRYRSAGIRISGQSVRAYLGIPRFTNRRCVSDRARPDTTPQSRFDADSERRAYNRPVRRLLAAAILLCSHP